MQGHHELWITELFNNYLAGLGNAVLALFGLHAHNADRPWANFVTMQFVVLLIIVVLFALLRPRLSMDRPGIFQQVFEEIYLFLRGQGEEVIGHAAQKYIPFAGTLFFFILFANLLGLIPGLESPTMFPYVPAGCAIATFLVYNILAFKHQGVLGYAKHLTGGVPVPLMPLMFVIEIISHFARPLSLTVRLYANMFAGEMVTLVFLGLVPLAIPTAFMGLHLFVSLLQAYIFVLLTLIYIGEAVAHEH
jgi:F-type H+-transporting ATPase subunit a